MIPILYDPAETLFTSNGIGRLVDCISCEVTEERNGVYECEFTYPVDGRYYNDILEGCIIGCTHDNTGDIQPFDIYKRSIPVDGVVTFNAVHISYRLSNVILRPFTAERCDLALAGLKTYSATDNQFTFVTDKSTAATFKVEHPASVREMLAGKEGSILDVYGGGEYTFNKLTVTYNQRRGTDTYEEIRYGKNIQEITDEVDSSGIYNAVAPFWDNGEGKVVTLNEYVIYSPTATPYLTYITNENGVELTNENDEPIEAAFLNTRAVPLDLTSYFENKPTKAQLRAKAYEIMGNDSDIPKRSISVDFVQLWQTEEYANYAPLQQLKLCDTVKVVYPQAGTNERVKIIRVVFDSLADKYIKMELGDAPMSFAETVTNTLENITDLPSVTEVRSIVTQMTNTITGVNGGHIIIRYIDDMPAEILIMDTDNVNTAMQVLRINQNGIGFSKYGVNGPFTTAWTLDGKFVADFITAGTLSGDLIKTGKISSNNGKTYFDLDNGKIFMTDTRMSDSEYDWFEAHDAYLLFGYKRRDYYNTEVAGVLANLTKSIGGHTYHGISLGISDDGYKYFAIRDATFSTGITVFNNTYFMVDVSAEKPVIINKKSVFNDEAYFDDYVYANSQTIHKDIVRIEKELYVKRGSSDEDFWHGIQKKQFTYSGNPSVTYDALHLFGEHVTISGKNSTYAIASYPFVCDYKAWFRYDVAATAFTNTSDEHLKNIEAYPQEYDDILDELEPIAFTWKDSEDTEQHIGLGARKTKGILDAHGLDNSGFVNTTNEDSYSINYAELTVMLLKRVQDLTKRIAELEAIIANT